MKATSPHLRYPPNRVTQVWARSAVTPLLGSRPQKLRSMGHELPLFSPVPPDAHIRAAMGSTYVPRATVVIIGDGCGE